MKLAILKSNWKPGAQKNRNGGGRCWGRVGEEGGVGDGE